MPTTRCATVIRKPQDRFARAVYGPAGGLVCPSRSGLPASDPRTWRHAGISCQQSRSEAPLTAQSPQVLPAELPDWPACTLSEAQLGDLELLTSGVFAPLRGFMDAADAAAVAERAMLADGTPWPVPVILDVPAEVVPADADHLVLQDQEGSPLAVLSITERLIQPGPGDPGGGPAGRAGHGAARARARAVPSAAAAPGGRARRTGPRRVVRGR